MTEMVRHCELDSESQITGQARNVKKISRG